MTQDKQLELIGQLDEGLINTLKKKGTDYATEDVLSNFKRLSSVAKALNLSLHTPEGYALFMVLMKIDRINNLLTSGKTPSNESVEDSFGDGINYFKLAYLCYKEAENGSK